ncbi:uncharacterized protein CTRU02_214412 [Colletotrichum truncatum]|uniref:Uncharacterized protein n=1 Tax=Colletotrichum truncatum TaxID=5467 RepID=A0ACC3YEP7_COLTU|nr:uncharacterized protein CTRU02_13483 [Colletotrichum truncatum]KAF6783247.1 hypothetical protein CTRU02_13483 [Colletotrichum truncatum]
MPAGLSAVAMSYTISKDNTAGDSFRHDCLLEEWGQKKQRHSSQRQSRMRQTGSLHRMTPAELTYQGENEHMMRSRLEINPEEQPLADDNGQHFSDLSLDQQQIDSGDDDARAAELRESKRWERMRNRMRTQEAADEAADRAAKLDARRAAEVKEMRRQQRKALEMAEEERMLAARNNDTTMDAPDYYDNDDSASLGPYSLRDSLYAAARPTPQSDTEYSTLTSTPPFSTPPEIREVVRPPPAFERSQTSPFDDDIDLSRGASQVDNAGIPLSFPERAQSRGSPDPIDFLSLSRAARRDQERQLSEGWNSQDDYEDDDEADYGLLYSGYQDSGNYPPPRRRYRTGTREALPLYYNQQRSTRPLDSSYYVRESLSSGPRFDTEVKTSTVYTAKDVKYSNIPHRYRDSDFAY